MIPKIIYHSGLFAALNYNYQKVFKGQAIPLSHSQDIHELNDDLKSTYGMMKFRSNAQALKDNTIHVSLNFQPGTKIDIEKFTKIQDEYLEKMGWAGLSYKSFLHTDRLHPHIHIVLVREKNSLNEFQKSKKVAQELIGKYDLLHEYDDLLNEQVQKMTVSNQVKFYLEKVQKAKNVYSIEEVQRLFNAMCPTYKMMINKDKKTIVFVHEFNTSFLKSSDNKDPNSRKLIQLYRIWKKDTSHQKGIEQITGEKLNGMEMLIADPFVQTELAELQFQDTPANKEEFARVFKKNFKGYQVMVNQETKDIVFVNEKEKSFYSIQHTISANTLYYKTTYSAWEEKVKRNQTGKHIHEDKETTSFARNKIKDILQEKLQEPAIKSFDDLKKNCISKGMYFIFYGNRKADTGEKEITGWGVYDETSGMVFKMSDINREFSFSAINALFDRKRKGQQLTVVLQAKKKRLPLLYFSPYLNENQHQYMNRIKSNFAPPTKGATKSSSNSLSNAKTNEKNNNNGDRSF